MVGNVGHHHLVVVVVGQSINKLDAGSIALNNCAVNTPPFQVCYIDYFTFMGTNP